MSNLLLRRCSTKLLTSISSSSSSVVLPRQCQFAFRPPALTTASISTSKMNRDVTVTAEGAPKEEVKVRVDDFSYEAAKKKWVSYGFDHLSEEDDLNRRNFFMFATVTVCLVGGTLLFSYFPDVKMKGWVQREAYMELARREALGLPQIDENLVPVADINLPTEEELGDFEIII